ncbi:hypothetical protein SS50377_26837 [Spironucleus salmonicida]|uniref:Sfi1 spindle body domain-containing protein n=1 Tax=Spironucleus salmonicida TaxID=348837 RepID=V6LXM9_9EUKA|nr:hypothetical protein SS50377_26837 [Spironucleus salmonicida]|eukprot:EST49305.1 Hypothetical protein SS50377_10529 [Spironucleus salmonicida]
MNNKVQFLFQCDLIFLKDIEARQKVSNLNIKSIFENEISLFKNNNALGFYNKLIDYSTRYKISLYQSMEKYKLARLAAIFSRLRQQKQIFNIFKEILKTLQLNQKLIIKYDFTEEQYKINQIRHFALQYRAWRGMSQRLLQIQQAKIQASLIQKKSISLFRKKIQKNTALQAFKSWNNFYRIKQDKESYNKIKCKNYIINKLVLNIQNTFQLWVIAYKDRKLREARVAAFYLRSQKMLKQLAFKAILKKFISLKRKLYKNINTCIISIWQQRQIQHVFQAFQYKIQINLQKYQILQQSIQSKIIFTVIIKLKIAYQRQQKYSQFLYFQDQNLIRLCFFALMQARESPYLQQKLLSYETILNYRTKIISINLWRKQSQQQIKYRISRLQNNRFLILRAFNEIREAAKVLSRARVFAEPWRRRRGIFRFEEGRTWEIVGYFLNHMRIKAGMQEIVEVNHQEEYQLSEYISAWIDYVDRKRKVNVILSGMRSLHDKRLTQNMFKRIIQQYKYNTAQILLYSNKLTFLYKKAFASWKLGFRLKQWALKMRKWQDESLIKITFFQWQYLRPYAQMLQRVLFELNLQGIKVNPDELNDKTIDQQIQYLIEKYADTLDESFVNFVKLGLDILDNQNQMSHSQINKYNRKLFSMKDFDKLGKNYEQIQILTKQIIEDRAYFALKDEYYRIQSHKIVSQKQYKIKLQSQFLSLMRTVTLQFQTAKNIQNQTLLFKTLKELRAVNIFLQNVRLADEFHIQQLLKISLFTLNQFVSVTQLRRDSKAKALEFNQKCYVYKCFQIWKKQCLLILTAKDFFEDYQKQNIKKILQLLRLKLDQKEQQNLKLYEYQDKRTINIKRDIFNILMKQKYLNQKQRDDNSKACNFYNQRLLIAFESWWALKNTKVKYLFFNKQASNMTNKKFFKMLKLAYNQKLENNVLIQKADSSYNNKLRNYFFKWLLATHEHIKHSFKLRKAEIYIKSNLQLKYFNIMRSQRNLKLANIKNEEASQDHHNLFLLQHVVKNLSKFSRLLFKSLVFNENLLLKISFTQILQTIKLTYISENHVFTVQNIHLREIFTLWRIKIGQDFSKMKGFIAMQDRLTLLKIFNNLRNKNMIITKNEQVILQNNYKQSLGVTFYVWIQELKVKREKEDYFIYLRQLSKGFRLWKRFVKINSLNFYIISSKAQMRIQGQNMCILQLVLRKFQLNSQLAESHFAGVIKRKIINALKDELMKLKFYNQDPKQKLKKGLQIWKKLSRDNALVRHKEVKAERYNRKQVVSKIFIEWAAICGVELGWGDY